MSRFIDITGKKYDKLKVLSFYEMRDNKSYWLCECDCGNKKILSKSELISRKHQKLWLFTPPKKI
jgi:hypothetical protein